MPINLKELIVICGIALLVFVIAKPVALRFMEAQDFRRRCAAWFILTALAMLSPSFWLFVALSIPVLFTVGRRDTHPACVYVLLIRVIPPFQVSIPMIGISRLFDLDMPLLVALCVMLPAAVRLARRPPLETGRGIRRLDTLLLAYIALSTVLYIHFLPLGSEVLIPPSFTDMLRRAFVGLIGIFVPYFVISRTGFDRKGMVDLLATLSLIASVMAAIAIFEGARHWLLYGDIQERWGYTSRISLYLTRAGSVRAIASTGQPLALALILATFFGAWLYIKEHVTSALRRIAGTAVLLLGLISTYSRGPWLGAACVYILYVVLSPRPLGRFVKAAAAVAVAGLALMMSPYGHKVVSVMPYFGDYSSTDPSILYRERLVTRAREIFSQSPLAGDQDAMLRMQDLRQGEGIIDIVNTYVQVLLANGIIGMVLFGSFILGALWSAWIESRRAALRDPDLCALGAALLASTVGMLLMLSNSSLDATEFYIVLACTVAYAQLVTSQRSAEVPAGDLRPAIGASARLR